MPFARARGDIMADSKRGIGLTAFAILFLLLAIEDFLKPFGRKEVPGTGITVGIMFFGHLLQGRLMYVGWLVGAFLLVYAFAILRMTSYALTLAYLYGVYVVLNVVIFTFTYPSPKTQAELVFGIAYRVLAIVGAWTAVILLRRRTAQAA